MTMDSGMARTWWLSMVKIVLIGANMPLDSRVGTMCISGVGVVALPLDVH